LLSAARALGHLLAVKVTAANEQDRAQVAALAQAVQAATQMGRGWPQPGEAV